MINFPLLNRQKCCSLFAILCSALLLQACGGQRDEPFDSDSSSSSSRGAEVTITQLIADDDPVTSVQKEGVQIKILDDDTFDTYWDKYTNSTHGVVDFDNGQVLLLDLGKKTTCDQKLKLKSYAAYQATTNSVVVVLNYKDVDSSSSSSSSSSRSSSSSSSSSCGSTLETQPYYFFYIKSRDEIIVEENAS